MTTLREALSEEHDELYNKQPKVAFQDCAKGYIREVEGPQEPVLDETEGALDDKKQYIDLGQEVLMHEELKKRGDEDWEDEQSIFDMDIDDMDLLMEEDWALET